MLIDEDAVFSLTQVEQELGIGDACLHLCLLNSDSLGLELEALQTAYCSLDDEPSVSRFCINYIVVSSSLTTAFLPALRYGLAGRSEFSKSGGISSPEEREHLDSTFTTSMS